MAVDIFEHTTEGMTGFFPSSFKLPAGELDFSGNAIQAGLTYVLLDNQTEEKFELGIFRSTDDDLQSDPIGVNTNMLFLIPEFFERVTPSQYLLEGKINNTYDICLFGGKEPYGSGIIRTLDDGVDPMLITGTPSDTAKYTLTVKSYGAIDIGWKDAINRKLVPSLKAKYFISFCNNLINMDGLFSEDGTQYNPLDSLDISPRQFFIDPQIRANNAIAGFNTGDIITGTIPKTGIISFYGGFDNSVEWVFDSAVVATGPTLDLTNVTGGGGALLARNSGFRDIAGDNSFLITDTITLS